MLERVTLTDAELELQAEVLDFLDERLPASGYRPGMGMAAPHDPEFSRELGRRGWLGMTLPRRYGGHERSGVERFVVTEALLSRNAPVGAHWIADRQTAPAILRFGTEAQKERFLPAISRGECFFSIGMSEPEAGSDLAGIRTRARRVEGGWRLTGTKVWTSTAHLNHWFTVLCRTSDSEDRKEGLSQLLVDLSSPGITISPIRYLDGSHHFNEVRLEDVFVPDELVLGEIGQGWTQVTGELAYERSGPDRYMSTYGVLLQLIDALRDADAGGAGNAAVGRLVARLWALRQMSLSIARSLDQGRAPNIEAAMVKDLGTAFENDVIAAALDLLDIEPDRLGPAFPAALAEAVVTAPTFTLRGGTTEILRSIITKGLK